MQNLQDGAETQYSKSKKAQPEIERKIFKTHRTFGHARPVSVVN